MDFYTMQIFVMDNLSRFSAEFLLPLRSLLIAIIVFLLGLVIAEIIRYLIYGLLCLARWEKICDNLGITKYFHKVRVDVNATVASSDFLFWFLVLYFFMRALAITDFKWLNTIAEVYLKFLPSILKASIFMISSICLANLLGKIILITVKFPLASISSSMSKVLLINLGIYHSLVTLGLGQRETQIIVLILITVLTIALLFTWISKQGKVYKLVRIE